MHEDKAASFDKKGGEYPVQREQFLEAAEHSQKNARYWELASEWADDPILKAVAHANRHIALSNFYKSKGNYHYYGGEVKEARDFFTKALEEMEVAEKETPWDHVDPPVFLDTQAHKFNLKALISGCEADIAKTKDDWKQALERYQESKKFHEEHMNYLKRLGKETKWLEANIWSTERDIQTCLSVIAIKRLDFEIASKHVDLAQQAAEKAFDLDPKWGYYRDIFKTVTSLHGQVQTLLTLSKMKDYAEGLEAVLDHFKNWMVSMSSRLFEEATERYLREHYQYTTTSSPYKPPYLKTQIDVYASKGHQKKTVTVCECKLRVNDSPLNVDEVDCFARKVETLRKYETDRATQEGVACKVHAWLVTNATTAEKEAHDLARKKNIKLKHAMLPQKWMKDAYWNIIEIVDLPKSPQDNC